MRTAIPGAHINTHTHPAVMADMHGQGETKADTLARTRTADDDYSSRHVGSSLARTNTIMACVGVFEEELPDYYMDGVRKLVVLHQMY